MIPCHHIGAFLQVARARIIAEPCPGLHHILGLGRRKILNTWPAVHKEREIGFDRLHGGLLQHDFRKPHPVRVGHQAVHPICGAYPPGQGAGVPVVPGKQRGRDTGRGV